AENEAPIPEAHIVAVPKWDETEPAFDGQSVSGELISAEGAFVSRTSEGGSVEVDPDIISYPTRFGPYQAVTDENGEFTLDEVNLDLKFLLWAYKEGYDPAHAEAEVEDPSDDIPYIALTKIEMGVLTGIVTDDSGEAVPGAEVLAYPEIYAPIPEIGISTKGEDDGEGAASDAGAAVQSPEIGIAIEPPRGPFQEYSTTTDADGRFVIERIPIGQTVSVSARKRGYEVAHRRIERTEKETFVRLYLIAFEDEYPNRNATVRDGGRYEVAMDRMAYNADETVRLRYRVMNLTEEAKTFSFPTGRRVEFLVLSMESNRDADPYSPDDDWEWPGRVIWRWSEGQEFEASPGEITLAQGESAAFEGTLDLGTLNSDERGFLLLGFLAGLRKETQSYAKFMIEREAPIDAQVTIAGVVTDAEGRPLARANVAARTADVTFKSLNADVERHTVVTDEKGCFALKGLYRGGTYEVTAFREGY
ncbi:MAG: carboxypeptidase regulatory-like domain-containing protein, partial [Candidatus Latescibacteria bacterium]|nr:carboxypeptidase regulatory-like domain-containing protein [Candidatus Latescibacterota bacterium]